MTGPTVVELTDPADPRVGEVTTLTDVEARRSVDASRGIFVAEGIVTLATVVDTARTIRFVLCADTKLDRVLALVEGVTTTVFVAPQPLVESVVGFRMHRGVVASVERWPLPTLDECLASVRRAVAVEAVSDHENVGGIFRNAAGLGAGAVVVDERTADPLYRRAVRVSAGHVCRVPWTRGSVGDTVARARAAGLQTAALTPAGEIDVHDLDPSQRWLLLAGAEGPGLTAEAIALADRRVRIPMTAGVDSLNVATSVAVTLGVLAR